MKTMLRNNKHYMHVFVIFCTKCNYLLGPNNHTNKLRFFLLAKEDIVGNEVQIMNFKSN